MEFYNNLNTLIMAVAVRGKIKTLYPQANGCYIEVMANPKPKSGLFQIELNHPNYNSLFSLAVVAFVNNYDLQIRAKEEINSNEIASVQYVTIDK